MCQTLAHDIVCRVPARIAPSPVPATSRTAHPSTAHPICGIPMTIQPHRGKRPRTASNACVVAARRCAVEAVREQLQPIVYPTLRYTNTVSRGGGARLPRGCHGARYWQGRGAWHTALWWHAALCSSHLPLGGGFMHEGNGGHTSDNTSAIEQAAHKLATSCRAGRSQ